MGHQPSSYSNQKDQGQDYPYPFWPFGSTSLTDGKRRVVRGTRVNKNSKNVKELKEQIASLKAALERKEVEAEVEKINAQ